MSPGEGDDTTLIRSVEILGQVTSGPLSELEPNPFVEHVVAEMRALDHPMRARLSYWPGDSLGWISYHAGDRVPETEVCREELNAITCRDPAATIALTLGGVRIRDIPAELMHTDKGIERITWLRNTLTTVAVGAKKARNSSVSSDGDAP